jgi:hypothetical protein
VADAEEQMLLRWSATIKMLANAGLWRAFLLVFGIPIVLLGVFVFFTAGAKPGAMLVVIGIPAFAVLWALVGVVVDLIGGFKATYTLTSNGIYFASGKRARDTATVVTAIGLLVGKPGVAGAGMLARSEQDAFIAWRDVAKATIREKDRYIEVRAKRRAKPIGLYCTAETFSPARDLIHERAPAGTVR